MIPLHDLLTYLQKMEVNDAPFGGKMPPPAAPAALAALSQQVEAQFQYRLPAAYLGVLAVADGLDYNGCTLYASKTQPLPGEDTTLPGFADRNELWQEYAENKDHQLLMFGETGDDLYLLDRRNDKFKVIDKVSSAAYHEFDTVEELLEQLFKDALEMS